jgi:hypothetical protein
MKRVGEDTVGGFFWLAVGLVFAVGGILLKPGTLRSPGPGFLPLVLALLLVLFSLFVLAKGLMKQDRIMKAIRWKSQIVLVAAVFLFGFLLTFTGFLLATFILMFILFGQLFTGEKRWRRVLFYAAATALIGWLVFSVALHVPFPRARITAFWR